MIDEAGAAYLAPDGFEQQLSTELGRAGLVVTHRHDRLFITSAAARPLAWAANTWLAPMVIPIESIGHGARTLRDIQRNWAAYAPVHRGRAGLITGKLPYVSAKPLTWGQPAPLAPLGSWTLLREDLLLASAQCSSPFRNGEAVFVEDRTGPPSRAYLKLWEALVLLRRAPDARSRCLDLGASPGGWTWLLAKLGTNVVAVDKAPLAPDVARLANVSWRQESAFALDPASFPDVDWVFSDVIAYPGRLVRLVDRWLDAGTPNIVCTIKFQGETDHDAVDELRAISGGLLFHLHHNRHELTFARIAARDTLS